MMTAHIEVLIKTKGGDLRTIQPEATVLEGLRVMADHNIGALLVMRSDQLIGVMTEREYARNVALKGRSSAEMRIAELVTTVPVTVTPAHTIADCMRLMTEHRVRHLPVLHNNRVTGIVSIGDLVNWIISTQSETIQQLENYIAGPYR